MKEKMKRRWIQVGHDVDDLDFIVVLQPHAGSRRAHPYSYPHFRDKISEVGGPHNIVEI